MSSEAVGHADARRLALAAIARGRLPHALLVVGEPGIGKRDFARWLVAAAWCTAASRPCGACPSCRLIAGGNHPDLGRLRRDPTPDEDPGEQGSRHEITVGQVRQLVVGALGRRPLTAPGRAVIVEDAEDLNEEAQNALLKTLEEPPAGALLVLCSAGESGLLETVVSRCQTLRLSPLTAEERGLAAPGPEAEVRARGASLLEDVLAGRLAAAEFARAGQELVAVLGEGEDQQRAVLDFLLAAWLSQVRTRPVAPAAVAEALLEARQDLRRHLPAGVAWLALGRVLVQQRGMGGRGEAGPQA